MTSVGRSFIELKDYVKKVYRVRQDSQAKQLAKRPKNSSNFQGSYCRESGRPTLIIKATQSAMPASARKYSGNLSHNFKDSQSDVPLLGSRPCYDNICYNYGELGNMRRDCPHPHVLKFG